MLLTFISRIFFSSLAMFSCVKFMDLFSSKNLLVLSSQVFSIETSRWCSLRVFKPSLLFESKCAMCSWGHLLLDVYFLDTFTLIRMHRDPFAHMNGQDISLLMTWTRFWLLILFNVVLKTKVVNRMTKFLPKLLVVAKNKVDWQHSIYVQ